MKVGVSPLKTLLRTPEGNVGIGTGPPLLPQRGFHGLRFAARHPSESPSRVPESRPACAFTTRCRDPRRRARTDRSPLQLPHRFSSPPLSQTWKNCPLRSRSPLPPRVPPPPLRHPDPERVSGKRARLPGGTAGPGDARTQGLRAPAGGRAVRSRCSERLAPPPRRRVAPPNPREVGSLSCGGGSQLLHIWLLLHIYILERASERARESAREGGRREEGGGRRGEEEERAEYTADIISTTVAEPYRTCFTAGGSKTSPVEQQPELQQPQDTVSLPLPPLPHATPDPFTLYSKWLFFFSSSDSFSPPSPNLLLP